MNRFFLNSIIAFSSFIFGCTSNGQDMKQAKMKCYGERLKEIREAPLYKEVMTQFSDTFKVMTGDKRYFGFPEAYRNKIDEAIFFNENKTECLLIVLQNNDYGLVFGSARIVRGTLYNRKWVFKVSIEYVYSKDYFNGYPENSFENISSLARYSVLTDGEVKKRGCDIDEDFWFLELKK
jgi:hypothetical protein